MTENEYIVASELRSLRNAKDCLRATIFPCILKAPLRYKHERRIQKLHKMLDEEIDFLSAILDVYEDESTANNR